MIKLGFVFLTRAINSALYPGLKIKEEGPKTVKGLCEFVFGKDVNKLEYIKLAVFGMKDN